MRQVVITRTGGPEVLAVREAPDPEPGPGQARIRVAAAGLNFADVMARMGLYPDAPRLPATVGYEVAGTIDRLGPGVDETMIGRRVLALTRFGGQSEAVIVPASQARPLPDDLSCERAAAIPVNYLTAWLMLVHLGNVHRGERVLVHAAAGGVGVAAVQICRWKGAEIIGTASPSKHERLRQMGVAHCIDYRSQDFEDEIMAYTRGEGVEIALDAAGGDSFAKSYRCLAHLGRLFMFGASSLAPGSRFNLLAAAGGLLRMPRFKPVPLMNENRGVHGVNLGHLWHRAEQMGAMLDEILGLVATGVLDPVVDRIFPFARAGEAHAYLQSRRSFGKVLLVP